MKNDLFKNLLLWLFVGIILVILFNNFGPKQPATQEMSYSAFITAVQKGEVQSVTIDDQKITGILNNLTTQPTPEISQKNTDKLKDKDNKIKNNKKLESSPNQHFITYLPLVDFELLPLLLKQKVTVNGQAPEEHSIWMQIFISWFPMFLIIALTFFLFRQQTGGSRGGSGPFSFGRSRAQRLKEGEINITFNDVAGCDEAKEDVKELVEFLKDSEKFQKLGARIPRGILLVGPPGTGKTLLAKAVAGEAKVPFFSTSGSDFVELFVGIGASRVRELFKEAKRAGRSVIFIDEIDALGRRRGSNFTGANSEHEQTLNQLLSEMDGFYQRPDEETIIVIGATNRQDVLDPALLRAGRFDRIIYVPLPDILGREQILKTHLKKRQVDEQVNPLTIAQGTPGFSGAELENLVNEAGIRAAQLGKSKIDMADLDLARDKLLMGSQRKSLVMSESEKQLTAYHESGHTIIGFLVPEFDPVYKVTIIPHTTALGVTTFLPERDRYSYSKLRLKSQLTVLYGGRVAEELIFGEEKITTGASNDIQKATQLARSMIQDYGFSEKLGPLQYGDNDQEHDLFGGKSRQISDNTAKIIDEEVRKLIQEAYKQAKKILTENIEILHTMAAALIQYETITGDQIKELMAGKPVTPPARFLGQAIDSPKNIEPQKES